MNSPLNERDFAEVRSNVLREIARRQRRNAFVLAASVAFAAFAIVFVLMPRPLPKSAGRIAGATQKPPTQKPTTRPSVAPAILPAETIAVAQPKHHPKHHNRARRPEPIAIASAEQQPITIELHTANPDVRIIWIAK